MPWGKRPIRQRPVATTAQRFEPVQVLYQFEDVSAGAEQGGDTGLLPEGGFGGPLVLSGASLAYYLQAEKAYGAFFGAAPTPSRSGVAAARQEQTARRLKSMVLSDGTRLDNQYDSRGRLAAMHQPDATLVQYVYDERGNLCRAFSADGFDIALSYDDTDQVISIKYSNGEEFSFSRDPVGNMEQVNYPDLTTAKYEWDRNNHLTCIVYGTEKIDLNRDAAGRVSGASFDTVVEYEFPDGKRTSEYRFRWDTDGQGKPQRLIAPFGMWLFDDVGRVRVAIGLGGDVKVYRYGRTGRLGSVWGNGGRTSLERNSEGSIVAVIDPVGFRALWHPDPYKPITYRIDRSGISVERADHKGRLIGLVTQAGTRTWFQYDRGGRLKSIEGSLQGTTRFTYAANGSLQRVRTSQGVDIALEYSDHPNLIAQVRCSGPMFDALATASQLVETMLLGTDGCLPQTSVLGVT